VSAIQESAGLSREIQRRLAAVDHYNRWIFDQLAPYAGRRILDVGCAIGNVTAYFVDRELVVGIDAVEEFVAAVRIRFAGWPSFRAELRDIADPSVLELGRERFDTVVCANVLEHVLDDRRALAHIHALLEPGGRLLLLVPAYRALWGTLDEVDHHHRRYERRDLVAKLDDARFTLERVHYMNPLGIVGWWLNGRILRTELVSPAQFRIYNRLVPGLAWVERIVHPPFGLSLVAIAAKPAR
jgi:SAM-dependent methyltransferase